MEFPNGDEIPQLTGTEEYKYLGTELPPGWTGQKEDKTKKTIVNRVNNTLRKKQYANANKS